MDTYGDMVTLMLCFFVLLYSMSTISEENWKALVMSFNPNAIPSPTLTTGGEGPNADDDSQGGNYPDSEEINEISQEEIDADIEKLYEELKEYSQQGGQANNISVTKGDGRVFITFNNTLFFDGESSVLREEAKPVLDKVSSTMDRVAASIDEVRVLGHTAQGTANRANNPQWDRTLSSQRAANVVVYIQMHSTLDPARLVSEGVGQWKPVAPNDTAANRAKNRRVEMIISGRNLENEMKDDILQYET